MMNNPSSLKGVPACFLLVLAVFATAGAGQALCADGRMAEIASLNRKRLSTISDLSMTVKIINSASKDGSNKSMVEQARFVFEYYKKDDFYRFNVSTLTDKSRQLQQAQAFDGEQYQCLVPEDGGLLLVGKSPVATATFPLFYNTLALPFAFLSSLADVPLEIMPGLDLKPLQSEAVWTSFLNAVPAKAPVAWGGQDYLQVSYKAQDSKGGFVVYDIYFSIHEDYYPRLLQKRDASGHLWAEYYVEEVGILGSVRYPLKSVSTFFNEGGKIDFNLKYNVEKISVNSKEFDDGVFVIDATLAGRIHDVDTGKFIKIPR